MLLLPTTTLLDTPYKAVFSFLQQSGRLDDVTVVDDADDDEETLSLS